ncbi:hypothetical protein [Sphingomonas sp.]|uniref:hypothetical protein n=1 Tax=Sphingomonas sp. TaxID=28214 RepID=UPI00333F0533
MSTGNKVFEALKAVLTLKDQLDNLGKDLGNLNARLTRLAEAHGDLRDRVSGIEGYLRGRSESTPPPSVPRIEG